MNRLCGLLALTVALGGGVSAEEQQAPGRAQAGHEPQAAVSNDAPRANRPARICLGGTEDEKLVVPKGQVEDSAAETTLEGCRIGGGAQARAPRSPLLVARRFATTA